MPHAFCPPNGYVWTLPGDGAAAAQAAWDALAANPLTACISSSGSHLYVLAFDGRLLRHDGTAWTHDGTAWTTVQTLNDAHGYV